MNGHTLRMLMRSVSHTDPTGWNNETIEFRDRSHYQANLNLMTGWVMEPTNIGTNEIVRLVSPNRNAICVVTLD